MPIDEWLLWQLGYREWSKIKGSMERWYGSTERLIQCLLSLRFQYVSNFFQISLLHVSFKSKYIENSLKKGGATKTGVFPTRIVPFLVYKETKECWQGHPRITQPSWSCWGFTVYWAAPREESVAEDNSTTSFSHPCCPSPTSVVEVLLPDPEGPPHPRKPYLTILSSHYQLSSRD